MRVLTFFLIAGIILVLAPIRFDGFATQKTQADWWQEAGYTVLRGGTHTWHKADDLLFRGVVLLDGATLIIEKGATIRFTQGGDIYVPIFRVISGRVIAEGSEDEKITFKTETADDQFGLDFRADSASGESFFRHVVISGGGYQAGFVFDGVPRGWKNTVAAATSKSAAVTYFSGKVHFENSEFVESRASAIKVSAHIGAENPDDSIEIVNSNFSGSVERRAVVSDLTCDETIQDCNDRVLLKNNWYGTLYGPSFVEPVQGSAGEAIIGDYRFDGWRYFDPIADPLVVIPGITGSAQLFGVWELDPISHTYADLMSSLERNGYQEGVNLFPFPYDWRLTNKTTALYLQDKIEDTIQKTGVSKVDVVAHSMGGLVARSYIEELEGAQYADTIDQLITLGTPHRGSPEAYLKWEAGEGFFRISGALARHHFEQEAEESGYDDNLMGYIRDKVVSVGELLPDDEYLVEVSGKTKEYPSGYPQNSFLEDLNDADNVLKLDGIRFANIIGIGEEDDTISNLRVTESSVSGKWEHGMPENFYDVETDRGLVFGKGDQTVPEASAKGIAADETIEIAATHNELPTKAQCEVFKRLTGEQACDYDEDVHIPNILLFNVFSPVDIQVVSLGDGKRIGKNFTPENGDGDFYDEIPGAYYTGSDTKNEFITIPNPEDGEYRILARGTDDGGTYRIEVTKITEMESGEVKESTATIADEAVAGVMEEDMTVEVSANAVELKDEAKDIIAPTVTIVSPESKTYGNSSMISVSYSASDDVTSNDKLATIVSLDGATYVKPDIDSSLLPLGARKFSVSATDEAGNVGQTETIFTLETSWGALLKNIDHYAVLGLLRNKGERQMLKTHIRSLGETVEFLERYDAFFRFHPKLRDIFEREIAHQLSILQKYVNQNSGKSIDPIAAARLVESMEALKESIR